MTTPTTTASSRSCPEPGPAGAHTAHAHTHTHTRTCAHLSQLCRTRTHTRTHMGLLSRCRSRDRCSDITDRYESWRPNEIDRPGSLGPPRVCIDTVLVRLCRCAPAFVPRCRPGCALTRHMSALSVWARLRAVLSPRVCIDTAPVRLPLMLRASPVAQQLSGSSRSFGHRVRHPLGFRPSNRSPPCRAHPPPIRLRQPAGRPG